MSKLASSPLEDFPEAAEKHLLDSQVLLASGRSDGSAYLSGYVVECALKSLWLVELGTPYTNQPWKKARKGHDIYYLHQNVHALAVVAGAKTAKYMKPATANISTSPLIHWNPEMRYSSPSMPHANATLWVQTAAAVFGETIAQMKLDGII